MGWVCSIRTRLYMVQRAFKEGGGGGGGRGEERKKFNIDVYIYTFFFLLSFSISRRLWQPISYETIDPPAPMLATTFFFLHIYIYIYTRTL